MCEKLNIMTKNKDKKLENQENQENVENQVNEDDISYDFYECYKEPYNADKEKRRYADLKYVMCLYGLASLIAIFWVLFIFLIEKLQ